MGQFSGGVDKKISQVAQEKTEDLVDWRQELEQKGRLDLLGYDVYQPMIDSLAGLNLVDLVGAPPRSIFLGRFGGSVPASDRLADSPGAAVSSGQGRLQVV